MAELLNSDKENAIRILEYWFLTELLNQESLDTFKEKGKKALEYKRELTTGNRKKPNKVVEDFVQFAVGDNLHTVLDSLPKQLKDFHTSDFTVFVGSLKKENCIRNIARNVQWSSESPDAKKTNNDEIALAILKFSKDGRYIPNSLTISPLAWAMMKLSGETENSSQKLSLNNYNSDTRTIESQITDLFNSSEKCDEGLECTVPLHDFDIVSYDLLIKIEKMICGEIDIQDKDMTSYLAVYFKLYESEKDYENETEVSLNMDFYSKDLAFVIDGFRNNRFTAKKEKIIVDYILGINRYNGESKKH